MQAPHEVQRQLAVHTKSAKYAFCYFIEFLKNISLSIFLLFKQKTHFTLWYLDVSLLVHISSKYDIDTRSRVEMVCYLAANFQFPDNPPCSQLASYLGFCS